MHAVQQPPWRCFLGGFLEPSWVSPGALAERLGELLGPLGALLEGPGLFGGTPPPEAQTYVRGRSWGRLRARSGGNGTTRRTALTRHPGAPLCGHAVKTKGWQSRDMARNHQPLESCLRRPPR
eukprot:7203394-Pyramimonas_sp.AAC.1